MIHCGEMHSPASERARQEAYEELDELEYKIAKWDDPQTQSDLELVAAMRFLNLSQGLMTESELKISEEHAIKFYREQKRGAE